MLGMIDGDQSVAYRTSATRVILEPMSFTTSIRPGGHHDH